MGQMGSGCGGNPFSTLEPASQAEYLVALAQEARLLEFALESEDADSTRIGARLQRAIEQVMDADGPDEASGARAELEDVLAGARGAGLRVLVQLSEVDIDGVAGTMKMGVLTTVVASAPAVPA